MKNSVSIPINRKSIALFLLLLMFVSLIYSKFLLSVSMILLTALGLLTFNDDEIKLGWTKEKRLQIIDFFKSPVFVSFAVMVLVYLLSGINSNNVSEWMWRVRTKSPFLFIPLAFYLIPKFSKENYLFLRWSIIGVTALSFLIIWVDYQMNIDDMLLLLKQGQAIPTPVHHIRYSLLLAVVSLLTLDLLIRYSSNKLYLGLGSMLFLILAFGVHFMAVRTGLVTFYLGILIYLMAYLIQLRFYPGIFLVLVIGLLIPSLAYNNLPSLQQKIGYMMYDWEQNKKGIGQGYSDSDRIMSLQSGWRSFKKHSLWGVGIGDVKDESAQYYTGPWEGRKVKLPHSQYVLLLAGCGIVGFILFFLGFYLPLFISLTTHPYLLISLYAIISLTFLIENTIETAVGTAITICFISLILKEKKDGFYQ